MALTRLLLSLLLLSSLLVISSANYENDQYSTQRPNVEHDKQTLLGHGQLLDNSFLPTGAPFGLGSPNMHNQPSDHVYHDDQQKLLHDQLLDDLLHPTTQGHYEQYQNSEGKETTVSTKPVYYYEKANPDQGNEYVASTTYNGEQKNYNHQVQYGAVPTKYIAIRGLILCNIGQKYAPLQEAKARITCETKEDKNGYGKATTPWSIITDVTDENGFFFKILSLSYVHKVKLNLDECKVYLEAPPSDCTCKVATDVNYGKSGAHLSSVRILNDKILYTVGPFIYTSYSSTSKPAGVHNDQAVVPGGY